MNVVGLVVELSSIQKRPCGIGVQVSIHPIDGAIVDDVAVIVGLRIVANFQNASRGNGGHRIRCRRIPVPKTSEDIFRKNGLRAIAVAATLFEIDAQIALQIKIAVVESKVARPGQAGGVGGSTIFQGAFRPRGVV